MQFTIYNLDLQFFILDSTMHNSQYTFYNLYLQLNIYILQIAILISNIQFAICNIRICNRAGGMGMVMDMSMVMGMGMGPWGKGINFYPVKITLLYDIFFIGEVIWG